jgi:hypothetical protein
MPCEPALFFSRARSPTAVRSLFYDGIGLPNADLLSTDKNKSNARQGASLIMTESAPFRIDVHLELSLDIRLKSDWTESREVVWDQ